MRAETAAWPDPALAETEAGLQIALLERPGPVVAVRLTIGVGGRNGTRAGAAHMYEHLLFRTRTGAQARRLIEERGGEVGATTTREQVSIDVVTVPTELPRALEAIAQLAGARPSATELEREREVVLRELDHEEEERRRIWQLQAEALFGPEHPLARPILGTIESLRALDVADLDEVRTRVVAGNAALAVVGPVSLDDVIEGSSPVLADRPGRVEPEPDVPMVPARRRHEERRSRLLHVAVGWRFDGIADERLTALRLAEVVLAHGSGSRLYDRLRTRRQLAYRVSTVLIPYQGAGHLSAVTACDPHHGRQAELAIVGEVERLAGKGPGFGELETARRQLLGSLARAFESSRRLAGFAATQHLYGRLEPIEAFLDRIQATDPRAVAEAAQALVRSERGHAIASVGRASTS